MDYSRFRIDYMVASGLCLLSLAACAETARQDSGAAVSREEAAETTSDDDSVTVGSRDEAGARSTSGTAGREELPDVAAPALTSSGTGLVTSRKPLLVLGRVVPGKLARRDGCIVVEIESRTFTAVFPPGAKLVAKAGGGEAVSWAGRTIPVGEMTRIPGGGSATRSDLAAAPPAGCPDSFYAIGG